MPDHTAQHGAMKNYIAAFEEVAPPPPYVELRPQIPPTVETNLGLVLTLANLMVAAIIVIAMMLDGAQAKNAIIYGSLYFAVTMAGFALVVTGALSSIVNGWQHEATERRRIEAWQELGEQMVEWRLAVEETRQIELLGRRPDVAPVHGALPQNDRFVSPYADAEDAAAREGLAWCSLLFDKTGWFDAKKVHADGRLKIRMCGSKRGRGSKDAGLWLMKHGVVRKVAGGYALNLRDFPTRDSLKRLLRD